MPASLIKPAVLAALALGAATSVVAQEPARPAVGPLDGNRYMHERFYAGDISAASAYLRSQRTGSDRLSIVDVRDATEYRLGHPAGARSAKAGNVLSNPEKYLGATYAGRGYRQVFNFWEGFVGMPLVPIHPDTRTVIGSEGKVVQITLENGTQAVGFQPAYLDLNKDGKISNADMDGWRYHQGLLFSVVMDKSLASSKAAPFYEKN